MTWLYQASFLTQRKSKPQLLLWIHSHVRGTKCCFSSIDMHTQFGYRTISQNVLGLVIELNTDGRCTNHDFYELSSEGHEQVKKCGKHFNLASILHESCSDEIFYKSANQRIEQREDLVIMTHDFREKHNIDWKNCKKCNKEFKNLLLHLEIASRRKN